MMSSTDTGFLLMGLSIVFMGLAMVVLIFGFDSRLDDVTERLDIIEEVNHEICQKTEICLCIPDD